MDRTVTVTKTIGWLFRIIGILALFFSFWTLVVLFNVLIHQFNLVNVLQLVFYIFELSLAGFLYYTGIGLIKLEERARKWSLIIAVVYIILDGLTTLFSGRLLLVPCIRIACFSAILIYFNNEHVKSQFSFY